MFDTPLLTSLPPDFALVHPLPNNLDMSLFLAASARCNESRDRWRELMAPGFDARPTEPRPSPGSDWSTWLNARAPGTALSRKAQAARLYRQHFEASSQLAFVQGTLSAEQMKPLQALIDPDQNAVELADLFVERVALKSNDGRRGELTGALVITRNTDAPVTQQLYLPTRQVAWRVFENRIAMEQWLTGQHAQLVGPSRLDAETVMVDYTVLPHPSLEKSVESVLVQLSSTLVAQPLADTAFFALPPELPATDTDQGPTDEHASLFGLLSPEIALQSRHRALTAQQTALDNFLGSDFKGDRSDVRLQTLQQQFDALRTAEQASHQAATQLLDSKNALKLLELRHATNAPACDLYHARLEGLRAEADLQLSLGQISSAEYQPFKVLLDAPDATDKHLDLVAVNLTLVATDVEGGTTTTREQELEGVLLFMHPSALLQPTTHSVLLYWPGRFGGLQRFATRQALEQTLFKLPGNDNSRSLQLKTLMGDPIKYSVNSQLYRCEQRVAGLIKDNPLATRSEQRALELEKLRERTLVRLTVPISTAREQAYTQLLEQNNSSTLAGQLPSWFSTLSDAQRTRLKQLLKSFVAAMKQSHALLERDLPPREAYSKKALDARLRQDFSLTQAFEVTLDLPDATSWQKQATGGGAPGTPQKNVLIPSKARSKLSLVELAQNNVDQSMWYRLTFMKVEIATEDESTRSTLKTGITQSYLRTLVPELDLAGKYESLITETFLGTSSESVFSHEYRRECLGEPWRVMLKLQGEVSLLAKKIDADALQVLQIAIDANSREAYAAKGKRIELLPVHLSAGSVDTDQQGSTTLSGVTFIVDHNSGLTLLYLPDSPDGEYLHQYDSLERARKALFNICLRSGMPEYLAGRAIQGDIARHIVRINQALLKNFDAMIGIGRAWPATTSLSEHLLNSHMGRLLQDHRATSRSNAALLLEHYALASGAIFNYLKMAFGVLPFIGTAIALYDAWNSANLAVAGFLRGDIGHGLAEVEAVLLSLIDAAMDVLPGSVAGPVAARSATRSRHLKTLAGSASGLHLPTRRQARRTLDIFQGYEYERNISLAGLQPATEGIYRNVYRHADGDFMISQGRLYRIELSGSPPHWRLSGNGKRSYKQPVALDEAGNWNTHYAVYGTLMDGAAAGGGGALSHMADGLDPLWPAAIRRWLPDWWTNRALRRQLTLTNTVDAQTRRLDTQVRNTNGQLEQYLKLPSSQRSPLQNALDRASLNDIELAQNQFRTLQELRPLIHGRKRVHMDDLQSHCAWIVVDRSLNRIEFFRVRLLEHLDQIDELLTRNSQVAADRIATHIALMTQIKKVRQNFLQAFEQQRAALVEANEWMSRISNRTQKNEISVALAKANRSYDDGTYFFIKTAQRLEIIERFDAISDPSWVYIHVQLKQARIKVGRALYNQHYLAEVSATTLQRNKVLQDGLTTYSELRRNLNAWTLGYPQQLDLEQVPLFLEHLTQMEELARKAIKNQPSARPGQGQVSRKIFETEEDQLLIGVENIDPTTRQKRFAIEGIDGHTETWLRRPSGKYRLSEPAATIIPQPTPADVNAMLNEARKRLAAVAAYKIKVEGYARQDMLPVDLEHLLISEAAELNVRAQSISLQLPDNPLVAQLKAQADELITLGRTLRTRQTLSSKTPTEGYLDDLLEQKAVDIRKIGDLKDIGKRVDGRRDFLQEYEVRDLAINPPRPLWYAHFHYTSAKPQFSEFVKGHLKTSEQRNLGLRWQQDQAGSNAVVESIWRGDIGKPLALKHFSQL